MIMLMALSLVAKYMFQMRNYQISKMMLFGMKVRSH